MMMADATSGTALSYQYSNKEDAQKYVSKVALDSVDKMTVKCGELACQHDSYLQQLESSRILSYAFFEETAAAVALKKKKGKKSKKQQVDESSNKSSLLYSPNQYTIALSDSVFFPEGGGQPADRGKLIINEKVSLSVVDAQNSDNVCILTCLASKELPHNLIMQALSAAAGGGGSPVKQEIDWDRRFDLMTQHSGQHLISAIALNHFDIATHSFSLGSKVTSYIDFIVDCDVTLEQHVATMKQVEDLVNDNIRENLPMTPTWLDPATDADFETKVRSRLLPAGLTGKIRLVEIAAGGRVDCNTCCGTHVKTLGALQMIKFFKMEKVKSTVIRVSFASGKRLLAIMEDSHVRQSKLTNMLSCSEEEHVARLSVLLEDKKTKEREMKALQEQLCDFRAKEIVEECKTNDNVAVVDVGATDMAFMTLLSASVMQRMTGIDGILLLLVTGADGSDEGSFLLIGDVAMVDKIGKPIAELLVGRGGGKNGKFQGKGTKIRSALAEAKAALINGKIMGNEIS